MKEADHSSGFTMNWAPTGERCIKNLLKQPFGSIHSVKMIPNELNDILSCYKTTACQLCHIIHHITTS